MVAYASAYFKLTLTNICLFCINIFSVCTFLDDIQECKVTQLNGNNAVTSPQSDEKSNFGFNYENEQIVEAAINGNNKNGKQLIPLNSVAYAIIFLYSIWFN